jgi:hypothetical protein
MNLEEDNRPTGLYDVLPRPTDQIRRKAFTRRSKTGRKTRVTAKMIRDRGAKGKWKSVHRGTPGIGPLKSGELTAVGYKVGSKTSTRRKAVDRAVKKYGPLTTLRKLNAVAVYTRRTSPAKSRAFKSDVKYLQKKYY